MTKFYDVVLPRFFRCLSHFVLNNGTYISFLQVITVMDDPIYGSLTDIGN